MGVSFNSVSDHMGGGSMSEMGCRIYLKAKGENTLTTGLSASLSKLLSQFSSSWAPAEDGNHHKNVKRLDDDTSINRLSL